MTLTDGRSTRPLSRRASIAIELASAVNRVSRLARLGSGTVIGGRVALAVDPHLLQHLTQGCRLALVSGTNGKTTTTGMLVAALTGADGAAVGTNRTGANMLAGHAAALSEHRTATTLVLEVDEGYLADAIEAMNPRVVVLLNLSRDQLDRISEVRMLVELWRDGMASIPRSPVIDHPTVVIANADDPMVVWAAVAAPSVRWVGAGQVWRDDAVGCPACGGRIEFAPSGTWHCDTCTFGRPDCQAWLGPDGSLIFDDGARLALEIGLPGAFNRSNAAMAAVAVAAMGESSSGDVVTAETALARIATLGQVAGRFSSVTRRGRSIRLLLAKNPAGWKAIFDLLDEEGGSEGRDGGQVARSAAIVLSVNARVADGFDTSWLWDVPFERLAGRSVIATGERCRDLAVRLRYAGVDHRVVIDPLRAVDAAIDLSPDHAVDGHSASPDDHVEFLGNYTAFAQLRSRL